MGKLIIPPTLLVSSVPIHQSALYQLEPFWVRLGQFKNVGAPIVHPRVNSQLGKHPASGEGVARRLAVTNNRSSFRLSTSWGVGAAFARGVCTAWVGMFTRWSSANTGTLFIVGLDCGLLGVVGTLSAG